MKYSIRENSDHSFTLLRYGEVAKPNNGIPNNCEFEFWERIYKREESLKGIIELCEGAKEGNAALDWLGSCVIDRAKIALKDD